MYKITTLFTAMVFIACLCVSASVYATEMEDPVEVTNQETRVWLAHDVWDRQGQHLGTIKDFVRDSEGNVSLAILSYGGFWGIDDKRIVVPYSALSYDGEYDLLTLNINRDRLSSAPPDFEDKEKLTDRSFVEKVYRYFGERPYWTE